MEQPFNNYEQGNKRLWPSIALSSIFLHIFADATQRSWEVLRSTSSAKLQGLATESSNKNTLKEVEEN